MYQQDLVQFVQVQTHTYMHRQVCSVTKYDTHVACGTSACTVLCYCLSDCLSTTTRLLLLLWTLCSGFVPVTRMTNVHTGNTEAVHSDCLFSPISNNRKLNVICLHYRIFDTLHVCE